MSGGKDEMIMNVGEIGNYYGGLVVVKHADDTYSWSITNYDGDHFEKIPAYLGEALWRFGTEEVES